MTDLPDPAEAEARLLAFLDGLGVRWTRHAHPPVFTVEEARAHCAHLPGVHCKNLFLVEKSGAPWLVTLRDDRRLRIPDIARAAGAPRLSFGKPDALARRLGVAPGSVTPLALLHDRDRAVRFVIDAALLSAEIFNCHPLHNAATLAMFPGDLRRFLAATGHDPVVLDVDALERAEGR